ncbi:MocR-like transcription factor YczR [Kineococcus rubinsiae]|uniref:MocR-like transcription factor YczR n=1 Tax=Kineococcus rubinsiae TaxID=2609562 RepID=UPI00142FCDAC|nr:PLP-dependent aminotransferase family protein [Kineococcus rubinsiae]NIZ92841.1 PLP-dependent aminotransferase family protein [Kineococcus rubinsiae]
MQTISARALASLLGAWRDRSPAYAALADRVRLLVLDGRLAVGTRLAAERDLAVALGVSRATVSAAYASLRETGHVTSVRGSGSVVRPLDRPASANERRPHPDGDVLDITNAALPAVDGLQAAVERAVTRLPQHTGGHGYEMQGVPELRAAVAARYSDRGLPTRPDEVLVTIGAQHAIALLARTFLTPGDRVLVETPTYPRAVQAFTGAGGRPVQVPVGREGWDDDALRDAFARARPRLAYLVPDFHNPTGATMPAHQRRTVNDLAARHGTRVVVDETMADLGFGDRAAPWVPFPGDVVHVGSLAKSVWGGLRIGWIRADAATVREVLNRRSPTDLGTPVLDQLVGAEVLPSLDELTTRRRGSLRAAHDALHAALAERLPSWEAPRVEGGFSTWVNLGEPVSSSLVLAARARGLLLSAGPRFGVDGAFERHLRVCFTLPPRQMHRVVDVLAAAWDDVARLPRLQPGPIALV